MLSISCSLYDNDFKILLLLSIVGIRFCILLKECSTNSNVCQVQVQLKFWFIAGVLFCPWCVPNRDISRNSRCRNVNVCLLHIILLHFLNKSLFPLIPVESLQRWHIRLLHISRSCAVYFRKPVYCKSLFNGSFRCLKILNA